MCLDVSLVPRLSSACEKLYCKWWPLITYKSKVGLNKKLLSVSSMINITSLLCLQVSTHQHCFKRASMCCAASWSKLWEDTALRIQPLPMWNARNTETFITRQMCLAWGVLQQLTVSWLLNKLLPTHLLKEVGVWHLPERGLRKGNTVVPKNASQGCSHVSQLLVAVQDSDSVLLKHRLTMWQRMIVSLHQFMTHRIAGQNLHLHHPHTPTLTHPLPHNLAVHTLHHLHWMHTFTHPYPHPHSLTPLHLPPHHDSAVESVVYMKKKMLKSYLQMDHRIWSKILIDKWVTLVSTIQLTPTAVWSMAAK